MSIKKVFNSMGYDKTGGCAGQLLPVGEEVAGTADKYQEGHTNSVPPQSFDCRNAVIFNPSTSLLDELGGPSQEELKNDLRKNGVNAHLSRGVCLLKYERALKDVIQETIENLTKGEDSEVHDDILRAAVKELFEERPSIQFNLHGRAAEIFCELESGKLGALLEKERSHEQREINRNIRLMEKIRNCCGSLNTSAGVVELTEQGLKIRPNDPNSQEKGVLICLNGVVQTIVPMAEIALERSGKIYVDQNGNVILEAPGHMSFGPDREISIDETPTVYFDRNAPNVTHMLGECVEIDSCYIFIPAYRD